MDIQATQVGLATAAGTVTGVRAYPTLPDAVTPASTGIVFAPIEFALDYNQTMRGNSSFGMVETLFSCGIYSMRSDDAGRANLVKFLAPSGALSVKAAIEADRTLGGASATLIVERVRGAYRLYPIGGTDFLGAVIDVRVWSTT